jgi:hypothetical protein
MKKSIWRRAAFFTLLYLAAFTAIVLVQFTEKLYFSRNVGSFTVSGRIRENTGLTDRSDAAQQENSDPNTYSIGDRAVVSFGGLEFSVAGGTFPLSLYYEDDVDTAEGLSVETLQISGESAHFLLSDGAEITFYSQKSAESDGVLISAILPQQAESLSMPFYPMSNAVVGVDREGRISLTKSNVEYGFDRRMPARVPSQAQSANNRTTREGGVLVLTKDDPVVFYRVKPEEATFNPASYIVRGAMESTTYDDEVQAWLEKAYKLWEGAIVSDPTEELASALVAEAARRGAYTSALSLIPEPFRTSRSRSFRSSPYLGMLELALSSFVNFQRTESSRLAALVRENPGSLLEGNYLWEGLPLGSATLNSERTLYAKSLDANKLGIRQALGIFEAWNESNSAGLTNPFDQLAPKTLELLAASLRKDADTGAVLVFEADKASEDGTQLADLEYNLRLGRALCSYGETQGASGWAAIGRSIILSVLSFTDEGGQVPAELVFSQENRIAASNNGEKFGTQRLYPILKVSQNYPHTVSLNSVQPGLSLWTIASEISAVNQGGILDITVRFPAGWPHHIIMKNVPPFKKIQLRDMDYRSDFRFDQYNAPGWVYAVPEQALLVKMVQRNDMEHIRVFF